MKIEEIKNGIVIDHITAGKGDELYSLLNLGALQLPVAVMKNMNSKLVQVLLFVFSVFKDGF